MEDIKEQEFAQLQELALEIRGSRRAFTNEQRRIILEAHLRHKVPVNVLSVKYGVNRITIYRWIRNFADGKTSYKKETVPITPIPTSMPKKVTNPSETPEQELERLRQENKRLAEALKMAEWMNHAKDVMIDQAEKTFNIPIRKKSGAKQ